jgi:hypothetical protein
VRQLAKEGRAAGQIVDDSIPQSADAFGALGGLLGIPVDEADGGHGALSRARCIERTQYSGKGPFEQVRQVAAPGNDGESQAMDATLAA